MKKIRCLVLLLPTLCATVGMWAAFSASDESQSVPGRGAPAPKKEISHRQGRLVDAAKLPPVLQSLRSLEKLTRSEVDKLTAYARARQASEGQLWLCGRGGESKELREAYQAVEVTTGRHLQNGVQAKASQFLPEGRWGRTATDGFTSGQLGDPITLTWSVVPDGTRTRGLEVNDQSSSNLRSWLAGIYGGSATGPVADQPWFPIFNEAFEAIGATCGVTFVFEPADDRRTISPINPGQLGVRGDIRIAARNLDGTGGNLALAFGPDIGDIVLDSGDSLFNVTRQNSLRLFNTLTHETGHALGLAHVCPVNQTKLLEPILTESFRGPQFDEYQSLQRLYGDPLERHESWNDNDSPERAFELQLPLNTSLELPRLSVDDDVDEDFFRLTLPEQSQLTLILTPGEGSYLEGGEGSEGCQGGVLFDSAVQQDLSLEVWDATSGTLLTASDSAALGEVESILTWPVPDSGDYLIRIGGDSRDAAQLYTLAVELSERPPAPRLEVVGTRYLAESGVVKNGHLDSGETVRVALDLQNVGELPADELEVELLPGAGVEVFSVGHPAVVSVDETVSLDLVFGSLANCGGVAVLTVEVRDGLDLLLSHEVSLPVGVMVSEVAISEDFNASPMLPSGWQSEEVGAGAAWASPSNRSASPLRAASSVSVRSVGEASLISPTVQLLGSGGTLSFNHVYDLENGDDGAVLEVSRNGGGWFDLILDPETTSSVGYRSIIGENFGSPIAGRAAWSGMIPEFESVTVSLPTSWGTDALRFRWRLAHDSSGADEGWWVDDVQVEINRMICEPHRPQLSLTVIEGILQEDFPTRDALLQLSAELPLVAPVAVPIRQAGTASAQDVLFPAELVLPAGVAQTEFALQVQADEVDEPTEILQLSLPTDEEGFAASPESSVSVEIRDRERFAEWLLARLGAAAVATSDTDGDGLSELGEYLLGTDPQDSRSRLTLTLQRSGDDWLLPLSDLPERADGSLRVQGSTDLEVWSEVVFEKSRAGLRFSRDTPSRYFRLAFSVTP